MAECECFELTLLICEQVLKGQKETDIPLHHVEGLGGRVGWVWGEGVDLHLCHLKTPLKNPNVHGPAFSAASLAETTVVVPGSHKHSSNASETDILSLTYINTPLLQGL